MNTALPLHLRILAEDKNSIAYRPVFAKITGSVLGAILLQQVLYRFDTNGGKAFYKFMQPCRHKLYKHGDSWLEELGFSRYEMAAALKAIGTKSTAGATKKELMAVDIPQFNSKGVLENATSLLIYWTDSSRVTWFWLNAVLLGNAVSQHYLGNAAKQIYLDKAEPQQYLVNPQSNITLNTENTPKKTTKKKTNTGEQSSHSQPSQSYFAAIAQGAFELTDLKGLSDSPRKRIGALVNVAKALICARVPDITDEQGAALVAKFCAAETFKPGIQGKDKFEIRFAAWLEKNAAHLRNYLASLAPKIITDNEPAEFVDPEEIKRVLAETSANMRKAFYATDVKAVAS